MSKGEDEIPREAGFGVSQNMAPVRLGEMRQGLALKSVAVVLWVLIRERSAGPDILYQVFSHFASRCGASDVLSEGEDAMFEVAIGFVRRGTLLDRAPTVSRDK